MGYICDRCGKKIPADGRILRKNLEEESDSS